MSLREGGDAASYGMRCIGMTLYEKLIGKYLSLSHSHAFRCICFMHDCDAFSNNLDNKSIKCMFLGYDKVRKDWKCINPMNTSPYMLFFDKSSCWWSFDGSHFLVSEFRSVFDEDCGSQKDVTLTKNRYFFLLQLLLQLNNQSPLHFCLVQMFIKIQRKLVYMPQVLRKRNMLLEKKKMWSYLKMNLKLLRIHQHFKEAK